MNVNIIILQTLRAVKREFAFQPRTPHSELFRRSSARANASAGLYPAGTNAAAAHYLLSYEAEERIAATARNNAFKRKRRSRLSGLSSRCGGVVLVRIRASPGYTERPGRVQFMLGRVGLYSDDTCLHNRPDSKRPQALKSRVACAKRCVSRLSLPGRTL